MTETIHSIERPLETYPGINPYALESVRNNRFRVSDLSGLDPVAPPAELLDSIEADNARWGNDVSTLMAKWRAGARPVVAGQQAGFAGGPGYTIAKLATIIRLSEALDEQGVPTVPIFWIATEDHDFDEVARAVLRSGRSLHSIRSTQRPRERFPVGSLPIPSDLTDQFLSIYGIDRPDWLEREITFGDSFARLLRSVAGSRVILLDSLNPALRSTGASVLEAIGERQQEILEAIDRRSTELVEQGFEPQVRGREDEGITLLYAIDDDGARSRIDPGESLPGDASRISTAALARPLLQDGVLRPAAFIGGPAEIAYYAQLRDVHDLLELEAPPALLRAHILLAPDKELDAVARHGLDAEEMLDEPEQTILRRETDLADEVSKSIENLGDHFDEEIATIRQTIDGIDPTLARAFSRSRYRIRQQIRQLERKSLRAIARRDMERFGAFERLHESLMPLGIVQDRVLGWISWELGYQGSVLEEMLPVALPDQARFHIRGIGGNRE